jgi:hypothetical protein
MNTFEGSLDILEATDVGAILEETGRSGAAKTPYEKDKLRQYRVMAVPIRRSMFGCAMLPMGEKMDPLGPYRICPKHEND